MFGVRFGAQPVFARQDIRDVDPLKRELPFVEVAPPLGDALVEARRFGFAFFAEMPIRRNRVGIDRFFRANARFAVFAVLQAEADLLRRCDFRALFRVPERVVRDVLEMPVIVPVGVHIFIVVHLVGGDASRWAVGLWR